METIEKIFYVMYSVIEYFDFIWNNQIHIVIEQRWIDIFIYCAPFTIFVLIYSVSFFNKNKRVQNILWFSAFVLIAMLTIFFNSILLIIVAYTVFRKVASGRFKKFKGESLIGKAKIISRQRKSIYKLEKEYWKIFLLSFIIIPILAWTTSLYILESFSKDIFIFIFLYNVYLLIFVAVGGYELYSKKGIYKIIVFIEGRAYMWEIIKNDFWKSKNKGDYIKVRYSLNNDKFIFVENNVEINDVVAINWTQHISKKKMMEAQKTY